MRIIEVKGDGCGCPECAVSCDGCGERVYEFRRIEGDAFCFGCAEEVEREIAQEREAAE
jgi:hypothetical protein